MGSIDGIPYPEMQDSPNGPVQIRATAEGTDLRLDTLENTVTTTDTALQAALTALAARVTAAESSLATLTTNFNALKLSYDNLVLWTGIMKYRIEARTILVTTSSAGVAKITYVKPFKTMPFTLVNPGAASGLAAANGAGWAVSGPPGPFIHNGTGMTPTKDAVWVGGFNKSVSVRIIYIAIGQSAFNDRPANQGGPGFDVP